MMMNRRGWPHLGHHFSPLSSLSYHTPFFFRLPPFDREGLVWGYAHGSNTVGGPVDDWRVDLASPPIGKLDHQPRP